ncbi:Transmembrane protein 87A,Transmembrane protein 87B [Mytilus coruscus]|uniref:Transmembrane protein 87A,Transmembrane protein 87B n=1 Tax=Mytilus coruscus TaxID=42192 RepID=A0A6J8EE07_MYTCO|nr:Transmembrane protein 87A,Transmembrane protein 87B [Mytilus coruscus]
MEEVKLSQFLTIVCFVIVCSCVMVAALPEQGVLTVNMNNQKNITSISKIMYNNTKIYVKVTPNPDKMNPGAELKITWMLRYSRCMEEYMMINQPNQMISFLLHPDIQYLNGMPYNWTEYKTNSKTVKDHWDLGDHRKDEMTGKSMIPYPSRKKRESGKGATVPTKEKTQKPLTTKAPSTVKTQPEHAKKSPLLDTWRDGPYIFILQVESKEKFDIDVVIKMEGKHQYISAVDWPLLIFYGLMGIVYIMYGLVWLVLLACSWRDLLRIQFWVGGVILLGMLEKAVFYGEYQSVSSTGKSVPGAIVFAELVSCVKRALARMLVIIVSLGFGIVKPRLGAAFHKVLFVGGLYFISSSIEGCYRALNTNQVNNSTLLILNIPLAIVDAIFSSLVQTTRTLRLRRNVVKLSLYRHFTNLLIFAVLSSVIFMLWSLVTHKLKKCITDWEEIWIDDAFWHLLFSVILLVMMFLWRPSANSQRYAFSPLLDADEDEADETSMNDAFDGMKMRNVKGQPNGSPKLRNNPDDDLKWVEENIPSSITDKVLPSLLDSDEEIMTTKYEANKMQ